MIGGSYDGTTANMVAARGADAPGLKAIVPELAISRWYGYAYGSGVRYFGNSERPTDEGVDTPLAFDFGLTRTPPTQPTPQLIDAMRDRLNPCDAAEHTERGYDTSPDYDSFWLERDYRKDARRFRASTLVVHGWQDYNVKQSEGVDLYTALPLSQTASATRPFKHMFMFQGGHQSPPAAQFQPVLDQFFETTLKGAAPGPALAPPVITQGRDSTAPGAFREESNWPPARHARGARGAGSRGHRRHAHLRPRRSAPMPPTPTRAPTPRRPPAAPSTPRPAGWPTSPRRSPRTRGSPAPLAWRSS